MLVKGACRKAGAPKWEKIVHVAEGIVIHVRIGLRILSFFRFFAKTKLHL